MDGGKLVGFYNLPWFAWGSAEMNLGDTVEYNTLVRVTSPYDRLATAIIKLFVHYKVLSIIHSLALLNITDKYSINSLFLYVVVVVVFSFIKQLSDPTGSKMGFTIKQFTEGTRIH